MMLTFLISWATLTLAQTDEPIDFEENEYGIQESELLGEGQEIHLDSRKPTLHEAGWSYQPKKLNEVDDSVFKLFAMEHTMSIVRFTAPWSEFGESTKSNLEEFAKYADIPVTDVNLQYSEDVQDHYDMFRYPRIFFMLYGELDDEFGYYPDMEHLSEWHDDKMPEWSEKAQKLDGKQFPRWFLEETVEDEIVQDDDVAEFPTSDPEEPVEIIEVDDDIAIVQKDEESMEINTAITAITVIASLGAIVFGMFMTMKKTKIL